MVNHAYKIEYGPLRCNGARQERDFFVVVAPDAEAAVREFHRLVPVAVAHQPIAVAHQVEELYFVIGNAGRDIHGIAPESLAVTTQDTSAEELSLESPDETRKVGEGFPASSA